MLGTLLARLLAISPRRPRRELSSLPVPPKLLSWLWRRGFPDVWPGTDIGRLLRLSLTDWLWADDSPSQTEALPRVVGGLPGVMNGSPRLVREPALPCTSRF